MEEIIKYVVEIDTSGAEAKMKRVFAAPGGAQASPGSPGRAPNAQEITDGLARAAAGGNAQAGALWAKLSGALGTGGNKQDGQNAEPSEKDVAYGVSFLRKMSSRVAAAGIASMNFARSPGQAGSTLGVALGGKAGIGISAVSTFIEGLKSAAEGLQNYSAPLFATMTKFGLTMEALKWKMGAEVGEALSRFMEKIGKLAIAIEPIASKLINFAVAILDPILVGLAKFADVVSLAVSGLGVLIAWIDKVSSGAIGKTMWALSNPDKAMSLLVEGGQLPQMGVDALRRGALGMGLQIPKINVGGGNGIDPSAMSPEALAGVDAMNAMGKPGRLEENMKKAMEALKESLDRLNGTISEKDKELTAMAGQFLIGLGTRGFKHGPQVPNLGLRGDAQPNLDGMANPVAGWIDRQRGNVGGGDNVRGAGFPLPQANPVNMNFNEQIEVRASDEDRLLSELLRWRDDLMGRVRSAGDARWFKLAAARGGYRSGMGV